MLWLQDWDLSERVLRAQVDFLKKSGLLDFSSSGMSVTDEGADILKELADYVRKLRIFRFWKMLS